MSENMDNVECLNESQNQEYEIIIEHENETQAEDVQQHDDFGTLDVPFEFSYWGH